MKWLELAEGVYARRYEELDLTTGLVIGDESCLVIDVRGDVEQGAELAAAAREITPLPWSVVYTHSHFDHSFGTTAFLPCEVWAHERCAAELKTDGETARRKWIEYYKAEKRPEIAAALERTTLTMPDRLVADTTEIDLGGRKAVLRFLGSAHTDHDLFVHVPDAGVVFTGDALEHAEHGFSAFSFNDGSNLEEWPSVLDGLLALDPRVVVPGHGEPVDREFVRRQQAGLREFIELKRKRDAGELTDDEAVARSSYPEDITRAALATP